MGTVSWGGAERITQKLELLLYREEGKPGPKIRRDEGTPHLLLFDEKSTESDSGGNGVKRREKSTKRARTRPSIAAISQQKKEKEEKGDAE